MRQPSPRLAAYWAKRLRESGFDDIETPDGRLRGSDEQRQSDAAASWADRDAVSAYYRAALSFLHSRRYQALPPIRRKVWVRHASGMSNREIAAEVGITVKTVRVAVTVCRRLAGLPVVTSATCALGGRR